MFSKELLHRCSNNDEKAQNELYKLLYSDLMSIAIRYTKNTADAKSSLNMGFVKIVLNLDKYNEEVVFIAWAKRVMINNVLNELRDKKRANKLELVYNDFAFEHEGADDFIEEDYNEAISVEEIEAILKRMPINSATVFNLNVIDGYSHEEIADMLDMKIGTSRWHLMNARNILKSELSKKKSIYKVIA